VDCCPAAIHHLLGRRLGVGALCVDARRLEDCCQPDRVRSGGGHMHGRPLTVVSEAGSGECRPSLSQAGTQGVLQQVLVPWSY